MEWYLFIEHNFQERKKKKNTLVCHRGVRSWKYKLNSIIFHSDNMELYNGNHKQAFNYFAVCRKLVGKKMSRHYFLSFIKLNKYLRSV